MKRVVTAALVLLAAVVGTGCAGASWSMPACDADGRLGIVAQSVPGAAYVPCVVELPAGWEFRDLHVNHRGTRITLESDRADRTVLVTLAATCDITGATPIAPSDPGVRTYQRVKSIDTRYAGEFIDVFPGGCVTTRYDFERGAHVALVTELQQIVGLYSRQQLRQELAEKFDFELDP